MCVSDVQGVPVKTDGFGYKVFSQQKKGAPMYSIVYGAGIKLPRRKWIQALTSLMHPFGSHSSPEQAGFHIYLNKADAEAAQCAFYIGRTGIVKVVRKVRYRNAFLHGTGDGMLNCHAPVVVASEIYIIEANRA